MVVLSSCLQIKYACLKNIGALHVVKGSLDDALEAYLEVKYFKKCIADSYIHLVGFLCRLWKLIHWMLLFGTT